MSYNPYTLEEKRILITGASSGIGRATAIECAKLGASCVLCGRNEARLQETLSLLEGNGHAAIAADLLKANDLQLIAANCGQLDGVVCNAGISHTAPVQFVKVEDLEQVFATNTFAPMLLIRALLSKRLINSKASIVFTSSTDAVNPDVANSVYGASKGALTTYMKGCAKELAGRKIRANAVHPGMVETPLTQHLMLTEEELDRNKQLYPLKRYGQPEEIAWAIIYLLSDASAWVTGSVLTIDGGCSIR